MRKTLLLPLLFLMLGAPTTGAAAPPPAVGYVLIEEKPAALTKHYLGSIEAINHAEVLTRTNGFIKSVNFTEGSMVEAGQVLVELEASVHEAAVERARAGVRSAEASLALKELMNKRFQTLAGARAVSRSEADASVAEYSVAAAALQQARAALLLAEQELGFTKITAPIAGRAGLSRFSVGSYVQPGSGPLLDIVQLDPIRVVIPVREADFIDAVAGGAADGLDLLGKDFAPQLRLANGLIYPERGSLDVIPNRLDPLTGTADLRARFPNREALLLPGGMVDVLLDSQNPALRPAVPVIALQQDREGYFVLLLDDENRVERRPVELGQQIGQYFMVRQGLKAGDRVVVDGVQFVRPGLQVTPAPRRFPEE